MIAGLVDENGENISFERVRAGEGSFPWPLPLTRAIAAGFRADDHYGEENVLSATTLIGPPQIRQLTKRHELYVQPLDSLWATYGTLMHSILEDHGLDPTAGGSHYVDGVEMPGPPPGWPVPKREILVEHRIIHDFEGQKIAGTIDRYIPGTGEGQDWKVTSAYGVKQMLNDGVKKAKPEYWLQANIYQWLLAQQGYETHSWNLVLISRDYNARQHSNFRPVEVVPVDLMPLKDIEVYIRQRIHYHKAAEMCDDAELPSCTDAETWSGRRCEKWCPAADHCIQYHPELGLTEADR